MADDAQTTLPMSFVCSIENGVQTAWRSAPPLPAWDDIVREAAAMPPGYITEVHARIKALWDKEAADAR